VSSPQPLRPIDIPGLAEALRRDAYAHCFDAPHSDVGGLLVGVLSEDGPPQVEGSVRAVVVPEGMREPAFPYASWDELHAEIDRRFPRSQIVGWYGGRPGGCLGLDERDHFIHRSFFTDPGQIAVIVDPQAGRDVVFRWSGDEIIEHQSGPSDFRRRCTRNLKVSRVPGPRGRLPTRVRDEFTARMTTPPGHLETVIYFVAIAVSLGVIVWELGLR
jgi:hypothetical protein